MRPEDIIANHHDTINEILSRKPGSSSGDLTLPEFQQTQVISSLPLDPMKVLDSEQAPISHSPRTVQPTVTTQNVLDHSIQLEEKQGYDAMPMDNDLTHLAINPLFQGMKHTINLKDSKEAYDLLEEIGYSIRAVIEGLSSLHSANLYSSDKHLRPIEDNPLHLKLSYDEMLNLLYSTDKCPVHLSAPSAFAESLNQIRLHHSANQMAISEALTALLKAFSPQALIARFLRYRRANEKSAPDSNWAWEMYSSYFDELTSNRQQGFEKLFWEIYEQSYDRHIRQLQQELDGKDRL
ncbi:type VI secretion system-associated FHA domain protein TagH [Budviciaceae bacterium BWR-B9]|uniref:Type VI secretion system-associated FHA domain protein TagH n=1 Tax=Limnobaculum allomyrinae TaxID=2791986 RepID=A0ABS1IP96_9GAMM|nr:MULTISPECIES: type VI secretion system-associated FHA domain protein TagH [Limnobaculum]MBK5143579.1 type VI secretion system-associated FHA domain protein TagH [Limnobaculum allomyrinae]MBV7691467.1 type VI secretion system-associated FHA domain protein TagH [Limnobaculum sp. M2-1]